MNAEGQIYKKALTYTLWAAGVLLLLAVGFGYLMDSIAGVWAAVLGVAISIFAAIATQVAMLYGHSKAPTTLVAMVAGSWLGKMFIFVIVVVLVKDLENFAKVPFAVFALVGIVATLVIDFWVIRGSRLTYVEPSSKNS